MAIAEYFSRNALAISQVVSGLDESKLASILNQTCVCITIGKDGNGKEGRALLDLLVRLLARLYPRILFRGDQESELLDGASNLASRINPCLDLGGKPTVEIVIGQSQLAPCAASRIYAGSGEWDATVSTQQKQSCGTSSNPFGSGASACLAAATLFRQVFLSENQLDHDSKISVLTNQTTKGTSPALEGHLGEIVLAGAGAIGNAAVWALSRLTMTGKVSIVDHEEIELSNLQRYVMAERSDKKKSKAPFAAEKLSGCLQAQAHNCTIAEFLKMKRHKVDRLVLALDSREDRCLAQASLPRWVANAWTQPRDLGVSTHDFLNGACVQCLYLPKGTSKNEDEVVAETLGVTDRIMQIRCLLHQDLGTPLDLLQAISEAKHIAIDKLVPFQDRSLRSLYTEGFCGGAVIPIELINSPPDELHVPLAHQSTLAGILVVASVVESALGLAGDGSTVTQFDVLEKNSQLHTRPVAKDPRSICICQDTDFRETYKTKYQIQQLPTNSPS